MHQHECNTHIEPIYLIQKINQRFFLYYIFVKKIKCWKNFKIMRKLAFKYSFYSHPEIGKFQGVTFPLPHDIWSSSKLTSLSQHCDSETLKGG
jgi:hypothetical protein